MVLTLLACFVEVAPPGGRAEEPPGEVEPEPCAGHVDELHVWSSSELAEEIEGVGSIRELWLGVFQDDDTLPDWGCVEQVDNAFIDEVDLVSLRLDPDFGFVRVNVAPRLVEIQQYGTVERLVVVDTPLLSLDQLAALDVPWLELFDLPQLDRIEGLAAAYDTLYLVHAAPTSTIDLTGTAVGRLLVQAEGDWTLTVDSASETTLLATSGSSLVVTNDALGALLLQNGGSPDIDLDALAVTRGRFKVRTWDGDVDVPNLATVQGNLGVEQVYGETLSLPALQTVDGDLWIDDNPGLTTLDLAPSQVAGDVTITNNPALGDDAAWAFVDAIGTIGGTVTVADNEPVDP